MIWYHYALIGICALIFVSLFLRVLIHKFRTLIYLIFMLLCIVGILAVLYWSGIIEVHWDMLPFEIR
jgi:predicted tellurium resistance membrane protein TerC